MAERSRLDDRIAELARTLQTVLETLDHARAETEAAVDRRGELSDAVRGALATLDAIRLDIGAVLQREHQLLVDAAHELRTPLTSVLINLELLADEPAGEQEELVQAALRSTRRMRRLVEDLLFFSRAETGRARPHELVDLADVLREVAGELTPLATTHRLSLRAEHAVVLGVRDDLHRLVLNLIDNALRHTPDGTHITAITGTRQGSAVLIVEDDGPGIPPELRDHVFERFARGPARDVPGSGLGLAIVRAVAESHGGSVTLQLPAEGQGARFAVRMPLAGGPAAPRAGEDGLVPRGRESRPAGRLIRLEEPRLCTTLCALRLGSSPTAPPGSLPDVRPVR
jgi:two-component system, OmpR family, sensor kinase